MSGEEVKEILKKNGFKLKDVAEKMDLSPQNFQALLNAADIKTGVLERISNAINKSIYFFYEGSNQTLENASVNNKISKYENTIENLQAKNTSLLLDIIELKSRIIELQDELLEQQNKKKASNEKLDDEYYTGTDS
jgi:transcriptional regulator with XRE-family HTH domain